MNIGKIPGLRQEEEFGREYKALSQLVATLEERSESIALDKRREESKKVDLFDVNKSISNQIQETSKELEKKLLNNLSYLDDLEASVEGLRKNAGKMAAEYKKALNEVATKRTEELVDNKLKDQLAGAKNLFFKKVLREVVVGTDRGEEGVKALENKLVLKEKLLKKALLAAEHYRVAIERVEEFHRGVQSKQNEYLRKIAGSIGFGNVKLSEELSNIEARKIFSKDFRSERGVRENLGMKDRLVVFDLERLSIYDRPGSDPLCIIPLSELKEIILLKEEVDPSMILGSTDASDQSRIGTVFFLKFKNERGGYLLEPESSNLVKWDLTFLLLNMMMNHGLGQSQPFKPTTLEANSAKIFKQLSFKGLDTVPFRKTPRFSFDFPQIEDVAFQEVGDTLIDWEILERCAARELDLITTRNQGRARHMAGSALENDKSTQTDFMRMGSSEDVSGGMHNYREQGGKTRGHKPNGSSLNYAFPSLSQFTADADNHRWQGDGKTETMSGIMTEIDEEQEVASPQVELDLSIDSRDFNDSAVVAEPENADEGSLLSLGPKEKKKRGSSQRKRIDSNKSFNDSTDRAGLDQLGALFGNSGGVLALDKADLDSLTVEKSYRDAVIRVLLKGVAAKGSGIGDNSGKFVLKLSKDKLKIVRYDVNAQRKESRLVPSIAKITFEFEYKDVQKNQVFGNTFIVINFIDNSTWEFKTPRKNKNTFYSSLIHYRLNLRDFEGSAAA